METSCVDPNTAAEFLEGLLSAEVSAGVETHMARCGDCRRLIAALAQAVRSDVETVPDRGEAFAPTGVAARERAPSEAEQISEGTKIDRFLVLQRVGAGGMGVVYAAYDPHLDRKIALKFLRGEAAQGSRHSADARARLIGEAQAIARITHPNVISVYDVGTYDDEVYIAMEFIEGHTLTRWLRRGRRTWREIRDVFVDAARGLAAAHHGDIVHRDFKPENVIVGAGGRVCVMDFGLARSAAAEREPTPASGDGDGEASALGASLTRTGALVGTPRYMAPEQFDGKTADERSDQFSLCVTLYEALYRTYPFYGETAAQLTRRLPIADQLRPIEREREVPAWLRQVLLRGMSIDPEDRYPTTEALIDALRDRMPRRVRWIAAAAVVPVFALGAFAFQSMSSEEEARDHARATERQLAAMQREAETTQGEIERLQDQITDLRRKVEKREQLQRELDELRTELATREARLEDIRDNQQRRREAARKRVLYDEHLDSGLVQRYVLRRREALGICYQRGRELNPLMGQWVNTEFSIARDGHVQWVRTRGLRSREASDCVKTVIQRIVFPKSHVATIARYGFEFEPSRSHASVALRDGQTDEGGETVVVRADGVWCDPQDPLCGVE